MMVIAVIIAGVVSFAGELLFRSLRYGGRMRLLSGGCGAVAGAAATCRGRCGCRAAGGRRDRAGRLAALAGDPLRPVALARISRRCRRGPNSPKTPGCDDLGAFEEFRGAPRCPKTPSSIMEMCIENPRSGLHCAAGHPSRDRGSCRGAGAPCRRAASATGQADPAPQRGGVAGARESGAKRRQQKALLSRVGVTHHPSRPRPGGGLPGMPGSGSDGDGRRQCRPDAMERQQSLGQELSGVAPKTARPHFAIAHRSGCGASLICPSNIMHRARRAPRGEERCRNLHW